ncbi:MAG: hypothetical protein K2W33_15035 [Burkholderiales bacterium]|nr:hypothetical protein [Burkholderiales bacterium]
MTTSQASSPSTLAASIQSLQQAHLDFQTQKISSLEHARQREAALAKALDLIALEHGVNLQKPLQIDSNGEFSIVALRPDGPVGQDPKIHGCGHFCNGFNELLNAHNPRCGISPGATLFPESGWCRLNHFGAERLVVGYYDRQSNTDELAVQPAPAG